MGRQGRNQRIWGFPGIEDYANATVRITRPLGRETADVLKAAGIGHEKPVRNMDKAQAIMETVAALGGVDAENGAEGIGAVTPAPCLQQPETYESAPLAAVEHALGHHALAHLDEYFISPVSPLHKRHAEKWEFRKAEGATVVIARDEEGEPYMVRPDRKTISRPEIKDERMEPRNAPFVDIPDETDMRWLSELPENAQQALKTVSATLYGMFSPSRAREELRTNGGNRRLDYDPLLGFEVK